MNAPRIRSPPPVCCSTPIRPARAAGLGRAWGSPSWNSGKNRSPAWITNPRARPSSRQAVERCGREERGVPEGQTTFHGKREEKEGSAQEGGLGRVWGSPSWNSGENGSPACITNTKGAAQFATGHGEVWEGRKGRSWGTNDVPREARGEGRECNERTGSYLSDASRLWSWTWTLDLLVLAPSCFSPDSLSTQDRLHTCQGADTS